MKIGEYDIDRVYCADTREFLRTLPDNSIHCCVTSPPYFGLRSYMDDDEREIGKEQTPDEYIAALVEVFREVRRVLRDDGTCWLNLGDSYASKPVGTFNGGSALLAGRDLSGHVTSGQVDKTKFGIAEKNLLGIPWRVAFALQADGWYLRSDIIWSKPNCMPESVTDRPTKSHEYVFLLTKNANYYYDAEAIRDESAPSSQARARYNGKQTAQPKATQGVVDGVYCGVPSMAKAYGQGRNKRSVWTVPTQPFSASWQTSRRVDVSLGDVSDGTKRIASPDCPVHGSKDHPGSIHVCDAREADELNHIADIYARLVQERSRGSVPTDPMRVSGLSGQNSGLPQPERVPSAKLHSNGNHRTDPAHETTPSCNLSAGTDDHIEHTSVSLDSGAQAQSNVESSTDLSGAADGHSQAQTSDGNIHILSSEIPPLCTCQFYRETTEKTSHFAVMPEALVEPCILAGCPETVCAVCGAPYERVVEREGYNKEGWGKSEKDHTGNLQGSQSMIRNGNGRAGNVRVTTLGFAPTCTCGGETSHGIVLDPFAGSGTVGVVAKRLKRHHIGIDLNPDYVEMANARQSGTMDIYEAKKADKPYLQRLF